MAVFIIFKRIHYQRILMIVDFLSLSTQFTGRLNTYPLCVFGPALNIKTQHQLTLLHMVIRSECLFYYIS
jgi:hypothetical protein